MKNILLIVLLLVTLAACGARQQQVDWDYQDNAPIVYNDSYQDELIWVDVDFGDGYLRHVQMRRGDYESQRYRQWQRINRPSIVVRQPQVQPTQKWFDTTDKRQTQQPQVQPTSTPNKDWWKNQQQKATPKSTPNNSWWNKTNGSTPRSTATPKPSGGGWLKKK